MSSGDIIFTLFRVRSPFSVPSKEISPLHIAERAKLETLVLHEKDKNRANLNWSPWESEIAKLHSNTHVDKIFPAVATTIIIIVLKFLASFLSISTDQFFSPFCFSLDPKPTWSVTAQAKQRCWIYWSWAIFYQSAPFRSRTWQQMRRYNSLLLLVQVLESAHNSSLSFLELSLLFFFCVYMKILLWKLKCDAQASLVLFSASFGLIFGWASGDWWPLTVRWTECYRSLVSS